MTDKNQGTLNKNQDDSNDTLIPENQRDDVKKAKIMERNTAVHGTSEKDGLGLVGVSEMPREDVEREKDKNK